MKPLMLLAFASFLLGMTSPTVYANSHDRPSPEEIANLPEYCKYTQLIRELPGGGGNSPEQTEHWKGIMGDTFMAMHHHCFGLIAAQRAGGPRVTNQQRGSLLTISVNEFTYVIERAPSSFPLLPEILTRRAQSLLRLGREREAIEDLQRAWTSKPDYWRPYAYLPDYMLTTYQNARAR